MPELPEVEVTMRGVRPALLKHQVRRVYVGEKRLRLPLSPELKNLEGATVTALQRRAKYILATTTQGSLVVHLGMTGHLRVLPEETSPVLHDHFALVMDDGREILYNDPRRFGLVVYVKEGEDPLTTLPFLKDLGPEPFSEGFNGAYLFEKFQKRRLPVKQVLMDNKVVVGVGNIYACEVLFRTAIDPRREARSLSPEECAQIVQEVRVLLEESIARGGTTIRDFSGADGKPGYFVQNLNVYGHKGEPCPRCGTPIEYIEQGQRHTYFCPHCQR